jgi:hypothetical protein
LLLKRLVQLLHIFIPFKIDAIFELEIEALSLSLVVLLAGKEIF